MTNKDLISKLNSLKNVSPDSSWLASNRELFLAQISNSGADKLSGGQVFFINLKSFLKASSQPVFALGVFMLVLVASSIFGHKLFSQAKPNDSLYIARIISEKAKLNMVFNSEAKNKLAVNFATNHAKDISAVLSDPSFNNEENKDQVAKLNDSFNEEIDNVKKIVNSGVTKAPKLEGEVSEQVEMSDEAISIAAEHKAEQGIQIKEAEPNQASVARTTIAPSTSVKAETKATTTEASSTETKVEAEVSIDAKINEADKMIDEAKESFNNKDYHSVIDKLNEVTEIIK
ncbi:MAG: hypothetical protein WCW61_01810 [Patescibacteria group bacterium]|jgi:hypothetical protein